MVQTLPGIALTASLLAALLAVAVAAAPVPRGGAQDEAISLTETHCAQRGPMAATLRRDFGEAPVLGAQTASGLTLELWTSDRRGSWTVLHHGRDGISCIVTTGFGWTAGSDAAVLLDQALAASLAPS